MVLLLSAAALADDPKPPPAQVDVKACAKVSVVARYEGYGYTHLVTLHNTCKKPVRCQIWTNVDSAHLPLAAGPGESASVATRKGSPSRDVTVESDCKLAP